MLQLSIQYVNIVLFSIYLLKCIHSHKVPFPKKKKKKVTYYICPPETFHIFSFIVQCKIRTWIKIKLYIKLNINKLHFSYDPHMFKDVLLWQDNGRVSLYKVMYSPFETHIVYEEYRVDQNCSFVSILVLLLNIRNNPLINI